MKRRKFIEISSKGTLAMGTAPVILSNLNTKDQYDDPQPTEGYLPAYSRTVSRGQRSTIHLTTDFPSGAGLNEWPVTFGVPFPRGAVADINQMRIITDQGIEVPSQIRRTATWHSPEGDVKWALVDMIAKSDTNYLLEYGSQVKPAVFNTPLLVQENDQEIIVETGPLRVVCNRRKSLLPASVWQRNPKKSGSGLWTPVLKTTERMYMIDHKGVRYSTSDKSEDYQAEVEEKGPGRITVKLSGWYRNEKGEALCQYITRIHHYAGQSFIRMVHTYIIAFDTDKIRLRDIAIPLNMEGGKIDHALYQTGLGFKAASLSAPVPGCFIQETADKFTLRDGSNKVVHTGKRSGAWVSAMTKKAGFTVGLKNFWQEYPRELEVHPEGAIVHLWPAHGEQLLDLGARGQLGPRYDEWDRVYYQNWYRGGLDQYDQAFGLAKTSELLLAFHTPDSTAVKASQAVAAALEEPPLIHTDPNWIAASDVFGPFQPLDRKTYPQAEKIYDAAWDHFRYVRENIWNHEDHIGNYGFFDYGDVNYSLTMNKDRWEPSPWRRMASRFYGSCILPWLHYVRSGDRLHLRWAADNARHVMDIDMCHITSIRDEWPYPKYAGGRYGGNGGIIHYGGNIYAIGPDSHVAHLTYFYYLTGDHRAWDVLNEEGEFYLGTNASGLEARRSSYAHRASGGALNTMVDLWNATWDKRYLEAANDIAETLYKEAERAPDDTTRCDDVYMNRGMVMYYQATGDKRMKDLFLNNMRQEATLRIPTGDPRAFTGYGPAMAFYFTGDDSFLCRPKFLIQQYFDDVNTSNDPLWRGVPEERWPMAHNTVQMIYGPYLLKALTEYGKPVKPAGDLASTTGEIWINNPEGKAFTTVVYWSVLSRPFHQGISVVREWPAYAHRNQPEATLLVLDQTGKTVKQVDLNYAEHVRFPYNSQDYPFSGKLIIDIPAGIEGLYRIVPYKTGGVPLKIALLDAGGLPWGLPLDRGGISHGPAYYFRVPTNTPKITLRYKFLANAREAELRLINGNDRLIASRTLTQEDLPSRKWEEWEVPIPKTETEGLWRLVISPSLNAQQIFYLQSDELSPLVSLSPEEYFTPSTIHPGKDAKPISLPSGMNEKPKVLSEKDTISLTRGQVLSEEGSYQNVDFRRGTLEFWIKPEWDVTDFQDATLLNWGDMQLIRRSQRGTSLRLSRDIQLASGFILMPEHWYHIAVTWDITVSNPFLRLYINNTEMAVAEGPEAEVKLKFLNDWTSEEGKIGGAAMAIGEIRVSKSANDKELLTDKHLKKNDTAISENPDI